MLGTPSVTEHWNMEQSITLGAHGDASVLVGNDIEKIRKEYRHTLSLRRKPDRPKLWDGHTAERCLEAILNYKGER